MKRQIKFRGKDEFGNWCYGSLVDYQDDGMEIQGYDIYQDGNEEWKSRAVDPDTVGQFTGFCDSEGNQIYEGDRLFIVKSGKAFTEDVVWDEISGRFALDSGTILGISDMNLGGWLINYDCRLVSSFHSKKGCKE